MSKQPTGKKLQTRNTKIIWQWREKISPGTQVCSTGDAKDFGSIDCVLATG
ncbi:MAG: hypothetical protein M3258_03305 [Thermoproteota archaeon]|nr:hypothetical protein [Thermoproteota archaeon]